MTAEEVAQFFKTHPQFFDQHPQLLEAIFVPHPYGGRAIPLSERQILALRDKVRLLEGKLAELLQFGEENDAIGEKMHRLCLALLFSADWSSLLSLLYLHLREDFAVPHVALRLWRGAARADMPEFGAVSAHSRELAQSLANPYCGSHTMADTAGWFGEASSHLRSFSYLPLRDSETFGLLALASEDPHRFYPEMGTVYLKRLSDLIGAAIARYLK